MTEWREVSLNELGSVKRGKSRHRPRNDPRLFGGDTPFFQTGDVKSATLHMTSASQYYSAVGVAQSQTWEPGVTCITIAANIAETAVLGRRGCFPDSVLGFTPTDRASDSYFVKYLLDFHRRELTSAARGTTQDNLSLEKLLTHRFLVPDADSRTRISDVLRCLDELIENNLRRIEVLEQVAQAIYQEWFVRFRYPGHEDATFVDSPLGPIPEGWRVQPFSQMASFLNGFAFKPAHWGSVGRPIIKIKELKQGVTSETPRTPEQDIDPKYWFSAGDLLFSWSADLGVYRWSGEPGLLNQHLFVVTPLGYLTVSFLEHALGEAMSQFWERAQGTTMRHIKRAALTEVTCVVPPAAVVKEFTRRAEPASQEGRTLMEWNRSLAGIRDLLLPKLVTGQIDVSQLDLDALIGSVA